MGEELLPLFPLGVVLFPRTSLPLHIFEERYKTMINGAIQAGSEFGIVLASEKGIVNTGCTARVKEVTHEYPDGRMDIVTVGRRRFLIHDLNDEEAVLRGNVQFFDDDDPEPAEEKLVERAIRGFYACRSLSETSDLPEPHLNDSQLSFQLAQVISDVEFRQTLLNTRSEAQRMKQLAEFFPTYMSRERHATRVRGLAPRNGHGHPPPES